MSELVRVIRYGEWFRAVVEETFRQGCVVRRDEPEEVGAVEAAATVA